MRAVSNGVEAADGRSRHSACARFKSSCFKALAIRETKDVESLSDLALLYQAVKDLKRADDYYQRAILIGEKGLGGDHPEVLDTMNEYAAMLREAGRLADAKKVEARAKELKDKLPPPAKPGGPEVEVKSTVVAPKK